MLAKTSLCTLGLHRNWTCSLFALNLSYTCKQLEGSPHQFNQNLVKHRAIWRPHHSALVKLQGRIYLLLASHT